MTVSREALACFGSVGERVSDVPYQFTNRSAPNTRRLIDTAYVGARVFIYDALRAPTNIFWMKGHVVANPLYTL